MKLRVTYDCHDIEKTVKKLFVMIVLQIDFEDEIIGTTGQYRHKQTPVLQIDRKRLAGSR